MANLSGVHNYCSRWCERCPFTDRCSVYEMNHQFTKESESGTSVPATFLAMSKPFKAYWPSLKQCFLDNGLDWPSDAYGIDEQYPTVNSRLGVESARKLSTQVSTTVLMLEDKNPTAWINHPEEYETELGQGMACLRWYGPMIGPKFARILPSPRDVDFDFGESDNSPTIKLLHLILVRAIAAATLIMQARPDAVPQLLPLVVDYCRLLNYLRLCFPEAHLLQRTVFDQPHYADEINRFYQGHPPIDPFRDNSWSAGGRAPSE